MNRPCKQAASSWYRRGGKRFIDIVISGAALIGLAPLIAVLWVVVRLTMGKPVVFRQERPGLNEELFTLLKFRTMTDGRDKDNNPLPDQLRLTRIGSLLRCTSLDELPEFWNVLRGDMSLVGPRPLLSEYLPYYSAEQRRRHSVRPGITGLAQVSGRNATTWADRLSQDLTYVEHCGLCLDFRIMCRTIRTILGGDGGIQTYGRLGKFRGCAQETVPRKDIDSRV